LSDATSQRSAASCYRECDRATAHRIPASISDFHDQRTRQSLTRYTKLIISTDESQNVWAANASYTANAVIQGVRKEQISTFVNRQPVVQTQGIKCCAQSRAAVATVTTRTVPRDGCNNTTSSIHTPNS